MTDVSDVEDVFGDGSCIAFAQFNDNLDTTGGTMHVVGNDPIYKDGIWGKMIDETDDNTSDNVYLSIERQDEMSVSVHGKTCEFILSNTDEVDWDNFIGIQVYDTYIQLYVMEDGENIVDDHIDSLFELVNTISGIIVSISNDNLTISVNGYKFCELSYQGIAQRAFLGVFAMFKDLFSIDNLRIFDRLLTYDERQTLVAEIDGSQSSQPLTEVSILQPSSQPLTEVSTILFKSATTSHTDVMMPYSKNQLSRTSVYDYRKAKVIKS